MGEPGRAVPRASEDLRTAVKASLGLAAFMGLLAYVLAPILATSEAPLKPVDIITSSDRLDANLIDCFIVRDASGSADTSRYREIEETILASLRLDAGDRVSYATFGSDTRPNPIAPPSDNRLSLDSQRRLARLPRFATTDFPLLFTRLRETITLDRQANLASRRPPHADAVVILSDGLPDLTDSHQGCAALREGFTDGLVASYRALIKGYYPRQEPISVSLVLVGSPPLCAPEIKAEWERRVGHLSDPGTFRVVAPSEATDFVQELVGRLRRQPRIYLSVLPLREEERRNLDRGAVFSVQYSAQSFLQGGDLEIRSASILGKHGGQTVELQRLHAVRDWRIPSTEERGAPVRAPGPLGKELFGPPVKGSFYLEPQSRANPLSEFGEYELRLSVTGTTAVEIDPTSLKLDPCQAAHRKREIGRRLAGMRWLPISFGALFLLALTVWLLAPRSSALSHRIERHLVRPHRLWFWLVVIFLVPMVAGVAGSSSLVSASIGVGVALSVVLAALHRLRDSPWFLLVLRSIEFIVLPLLIEGAASRIY